MVQRGIDVQPMSFLTWCWNSLKTHNMNL
jgi:hypothetical protein